MIPAAKIGCGVSRSAGKARVVCFKNVASLRGTYSAVLYADRLEVLHHAGAQSSIVFTARQPLPR